MVKSHGQRTFQDLDLQQPKTTTKVSHFQTFHQSNIMSIVTEECFTTALDPVGMWEKEQEAWTEEAVRKNPDMERFIRAHHDLLMSEPGAEPEDEFVYIGDHRLPKGASWTLWQVEQWDLRHKWARWGIEDEPVNGPTGLLDWAHGWAERERQKDWGWEFYQPIKKRKL